MRKWRGPLKIPDHAHPVVIRLFREMNYQQIGILDMSEKSGVNKNTLKDWRIRTVPRIADLDACFKVLGKKLTVISDD